jgi:hypothetical protein
MSNVLLASAASLSSSPVELVILVASIILLSLRTWIGVTGVVLTQRASQLLTSTTLFLILVFFVLVYVRFRALG